MRKLLTGAAVVAAIAITAMPIQAQTLIKVASFVPPQSVGVSRVIKPWLEAVQKDVGSELKLQGFWGGTLGKDPRKQYELMKNGVADVSWVLPGYTAGQFPQMSVFELPFLFHDAIEASIVGWRLHEKGLLKGMEGVHVVGVFAAEPNSIFMKVKIDSLDDLKNKKIRSVGAIHAYWLQPFRASPQTMTATELNEALNRGTLDGVIQGWTGMRTFKTLPLVEQAYSVPTGTIPFLLLMNEKTWNGLSKKSQAAVMKHGGMAMAKSGGGAYKELAESIHQAEVKAGRIVISQPNPERMKAFAKRSEQVHQWWIEKTEGGRAVYDAVRAALKDLRG